MTKDKKHNEAKKRQNKPLLEVSKKAKEALSLHCELERIRKQVEELRRSSSEYKDRVEDLEIHINLLTRFLTTICIEKFGMRVGVLKRLIKRIEKEAIRESQISHLESLYKLPHKSTKKPPLHPPRSKNEPWDEIS